MPPPSPSHPAPCPAHLEGSDSDSACSTRECSSRLLDTMNWARSPTTLEEGVTCRKTRTRIHSHEHARGSERQEAVALHGEKTRRWAEHVCAAACFVSRQGRPCMQPVMRSTGTASVAPARLGGRECGAVGHEAAWNTCLDNVAQRAVGGCVRVLHALPLVAQPQRGGLELKVGVLPSGHLVDVHIARAAAGQGGGAGASVGTGVVGVLVDGVNSRGGDARGRWGAEAEAWWNARGWRARQARHAPGRAGVHCNMLEGAARLTQRRSSLQVHPPPLQVGLEGRVQQASLLPVVDQRQDGLGVNASVQVGACRGTRMEGKNGGSGVGAEAMGHWHEPVGLQLVGGCAQVALRKQAAPAVRLPDTCTSRPLTRQRVHNGSHGWLAGGAAHGVNAAVNEVSACRSRSQLRGHARAGGVVGVPAGRREVHSGRHTAAAGGTQGQCKWCSQAEQRL